MDCDSPGPIEWAQGRPQEVLNRLAPHLGEGRIWVTRRGSLAGRHEQMSVLKEDVVVSVEAGGGGYSICGEVFLSTED